MNKFFKDFSKCLFIVYLSFVAMQAANIDTNINNNEIINESQESNKNYKQLIIDLIVDLIVVGLEVLLIYSLFVTMNETYRRRLSYDAYSTTWRFVEFVEVVKVVEVFEVFKPYKPFKPFNLFELAKITKTTETTKIFGDVVGVKVVEIPEVVEVVEIPEVVEVVEIPQKFVAFQGTGRLLGEKAPYSLTRFIKLFHS